MTDHDDDLLAGWLTDGPNSGPGGALEAALRRARSTRQRPGWLVSLSGGTIARQPGVSVMRYAVVAVALVALLGLLVGAMLVGGSLTRPSAPAMVDDSAKPSAPDSSPLPTEQPPIGLVAYTVTEQLEPGEGACTGNGPPSLCSPARIWVSRIDGSEAHPLFPADFDGRELIGWSPDGSRLLIRGGPGLLLSDPSGSVRRTFAYGDLCAYPCAGMETFSFSPDGTRLAFVRAYPDVENSTVIAILDLASGQVSELTSTRTTNGSSDEQCWISSRCEGMDDTPRWSPDGSRLVFARQVMSPEPGSAWTSAVVYVVNPDGSDLHRVTPQGFTAIDPSWSPDGSQLVFINTVMIVNDAHTSVTDMRYDIYTVRPNGTALRRLTDGGISARPDWTVDGRLTFARRDENWIMNADGGNQAVLGNSLTELTAAGCVTCIYPLESGADAFWQPMP
jgi:hypothetical protein